MITTTSSSTKFKVGIFTLVGLFSILGITVLVNNRPFWWRSCQLVKINVKDATGLKNKSPVRSLGIEIGYLNSVELLETHVRLGICLTAPVEVLDSTIAYIRGEGFLGDNFVELKPVKYNGFKVGDESSNREEGGALSPIQSALNWLLPEARAEKPPVESKGEAKSDDKAETKSAIKSEIKSEGTEGAPESVDLISTRKPQSKSEMRNFGREIPVGEERQDVQHLVSRVDELVQEMSGLTGNLKKTLNPEEMKRTMDQLNVTLQSANKTLSPESGLNQTAQRTLAKLEDAIDQFRDQATRINKGEGSLGMILNRPEYAEELAKAIKNINRLLNKVEYVQFKIDIGGSILPAYSGGRAWFNLGIWPNPTRYFLFGVTSDPRGKITNTLITTTTVAGGVTVTNSSQTQTIDQTSLQITAMIGKLFFERLDLSVGVLYGDGAASVKGFLGPQGNEKLVELRTDLYFRTNSASLDDRLLITYRPHPNAYVSGGVESFVGLPGAGAPNYTYGAGITFNDDDIKLLFTLR